MTKDRLDELSAELDDLMPPEVGMHVSGYEAPSEDLISKPETGSPANPVADTANNTHIALPQLTQ